MVAGSHRTGGAIDSQSGPSATSAPSLASSAAIAAMRSVSFTRQLPILRSVDVPVAKSAVIAAVMAASGMRLKSASMGCNGRVPRTSIQSTPRSTTAPIAASVSAKRTSPWMLSRPTPSTRTGPPPIAPAARKYEAEDASPSTAIEPGLA